MAEDRRRNLALHRSEGSRGVTGVVPRASYRQMLKRPHYLYGIAVTLLLALLGWWALRTVKTAVRDKLEQELDTIVAADVTALDIWLQAQLKTAQYIAGEPQVREWVTALAGSTAAALDDECRRRGR